MILATERKRGKFGSGRLSRDPTQASLVFFFFHSSDTNGIIFSYKCDSPATATGVHILQLNLQLTFMYRGFFPHSPFLAHVEQSRLLSLQPDLRSTMI